MTPRRRQGSDNGRPPMHLYRGDLSFAVELLADTPAQADAKLERLVDEIRPYLAKTVRARRIGSCELVPDTIAAHEASEV